MSNLFTRRLRPGLAPGVQVNQLVDQSEITQDRHDQFFAGMLKLPRGRIDRPFLVRPGEVLAKIGNGASLGKRTQEYKSHVAISEALRHGAAGAVLQRLVGADARNRYIIIKSGISFRLTPTIRNDVIRTVAITAQGSGYSHPTVSFSSGADPLGRAAIEINTSTGAITRVIVAGGTAGQYSNGVAVTFSGGGSGFAGVLDNVPADGTLNGATVTITNQGVNYVRPTITKASGPGTGAQFIARIPVNGPADGRITAILVADGGHGYAAHDAATPSVLAITDASGTGAAAHITATIDGVITALAAPANIDYLFGTPKITIAAINGGTGIGAAATMTVANGVITNITMTNGGSGYATGKVQVTAALANSPSFSLSNLPPDPDDETWMLAIRDLECFNNGVIVALHSDEKTNANGSRINNETIKVRIIDPARPRANRYYLTGDLNDGGVDDFNISTFLPDTTARQTDNIEVIVGAAGSVHTSSVMYGLDADENEKWVFSEVLRPFTEGNLEPVAATYRAARQRLANTPINYQYISSLDTDSIAIIKELVQLSFLTNKNLRFDVQGDTDAEAVAFINSLNMSERLENHLIHAFWCPLTVEDPTAQNGSIQMGAATLNIAFACARNARKDSRGFAPKHYPIMGKDWPLDRARKNIRAPRVLGRAALNRLAAAKINPVIYEDGRYIFGNAITCADVDVSLRRLISVTDMSTSIDDAVARFCNGVKGYPVEESIKMTSDYLKQLFDGAEAAGWIVPSDDSELLGRPYKYEILPDEARPLDAFIVNYGLRYQGTAMYIYITQTYIR